MEFIVAVDGPAGTGKGTVTDLIAKKYNLINIDTGAMYRCVTIEVIEKGIDLDNFEDVKQMLEDINIEFKNDKDKQLVFLNGKDVTKEIRTQKVNDNISKVAATKQIRDCMNDMQKKLAKGKNVIMEGRDIGTVVFPNANLKIYLDADVEERANRRYKQNLENNISVSYNEVLESVKKRDKLDSEREFGALKKADDAIVIDTTNLSIDEVVEKVSELIELKK